MKFNQSKMISICLNNSILHFILEEPNSCFFLTIEITSTIEGGVLIGGRK